MVAGRILPSALAAVAPGLGRPTSREQARRYGGLELASIRRGAVTNRQPIETRNVPQSSRRLRSFFDDFYNRVHVIPAAIDFGAVAAESKQTFRIWNAWLRPVTLLDVDALSDEGLRLARIEPGFVYKPLAAYAYEVIASEDGPTAFKSLYRFRFDTNEAIGLDVAGERARLLPFFPNWREPYTVTKDYRTEIITSRSGKEQRRSLRQTARKSIEFSAMSRGAAQLRRFNRHMATWQNRSIIMGEETKFATIAKAVGPGNTVFEVEEVPSWAVPGTPVFVRSDYAEASTEIKDVIGNTIVLEGTVADAMPAGAFILKAVFGRIQDALASTRHTAALAETAIKMDVTPGTELRARARPLALALDGRPVFLLRPNWRDAPQITYIHPRDTLDYGQGRTLVTTPIDFTTRRMSYLFSGRAREDIAEVENLFDLVRGQAGEFYYPSYEHDLPFDFDLIAGTRTMKFSGLEMRDAYADDTVHRAVMVLMPDDTVYLNSFQETPKAEEGDSVFTFKHDWPVNVLAGAPKMVSWLYATRFATDKLAVEWLTRTVATVKTTFVTLEDLPYEL